VDAAACIREETTEVTGVVGARADVGEDAEGEAAAAAVAPMLESQRRKNTDSRWAGIEAIPTLGRPASRVTYGTSHRVFRAC
jgi:hypothetical protein